MLGSEHMNGQGYLRLKGRGEGSLLSREAEDAWQYGSELALEQLMGRWVSWGDP